MYQLQVVNFEYLLVFLVFHDKTLLIFRFWTFGWTKQAIFR